MPKDLSGAAEIERASDFLSSPPGQLQELYFRSLDRVSLRVPGLERHPTILKGLISLQAGIRSYQESPSGSERSILVEVSVQVDFAIQIAARVEAIARAHLSEDTPSLKPMKETAALIAKQVAQLSPGQRLLIPGGYRHRAGRRLQGHAALYEIWTEERGACLKVINTGEGQWSSCDTIYTRIPNQSLNSRFFRKILSAQCATSPVENMTMVYEQLNLHLGNHKIRGRPHSLQNKPCCSYKVGQSWLHGRLGDALYLKVKLLTTQQLISRCQESREAIVSYLLKKGIQSNAKNWSWRSLRFEGEPLFETLLDEASAVVKKREIKLLDLEDNPDY